ncbi:MAG: tetratricopeptide repeat protein [Phycisphaerales bacterium JB054]
MPTPDELMQSAIASMQAGQFGPALEHLNQAAALAPNNADILRMLGECRFRVGQPGPGLEALQASLRLDPKNTRTWFSVGAILALTNRSAQAAEAFAKVVELEPENAVAVACLAKAQQTIKQVDEAIKTYQRAIELQPDHLEARTDLANCYLHVGRIDDAIAEFRHVIAKKPDHLAALDCLCTAMNYPDNLDPAEVFAAHKAFGDAVMNLPSNTLPSVPGALPTDFSPDRPLRIGYLSADFYEHSVAYFARALLADRDATNFQTYCYHTGAALDSVTDQFRELTDNWRHVRTLNDAQLAAKIRADRIDILVELTGHTQHSRLHMLRDKPAPVVVTYLGYPNTTGLPTIDYRIVDELTDTPESDQYHTERLVRLPGCFLCYTPRKDAPAVAPPPSVENGYVTFGSFNATKKITPRVMALWCRILREVPTARLVLKGEAFSSPVSLAHYEAMLTEHQIDRSRVDLLGRIASKADHLDAYRLLDIGLDPFPYNGTTTTCEALWMGVPVLSLAGSNHASRVGLSLLTAVGLPELALHDEDALVRAAADLASDRERLQSLRSTMRDRVAGSPLCDGAGFMRRLETAYRSMWHEACARH